MIKTKVNEYFLTITSATITPLLNGAISGAYSTVYNLREDIIANFTSTLHPVFTKQAMSLFFKGEVRPLDLPILVSLHLEKL